MDVEQEEMQFLGIYGIFRETTKLIFTWRRIFSQITLALILPLSFLFLAHMEISDLFLRKIMFDEFVLDQTQTSTPSFDKLSDVVSSEKVYFFLFQIMYLVIFIVLSLLSTSAVVYTVASIYTGRDVAFKPVMSVVPKVWKRLLLTFLCVFISFVGYSIASLLVITFLFFFIILAFRTAGGGVFLFLYVVQILYLAGAFYLTAIWQLSNVISVLEDSYGFKAMGKSYGLVKGKLGTSVVIILCLSLPLGTVRFVFGHLVVRTSSLGILSKGTLGILCFLLFFIFFLLKLVTETVLYFVCKSYHHENIDKSALSDHLEVYLLGEYVPLRPRDVQLEKFQV
ncbi:uncharacterized protein LOC105435860 [Cucumis sativus]|uniref:Transmembrane protein n=1 Tax=Cucumis sativus TaxID=3659 RepID=A0A0A0KDW0_CUCSA|nr:uncharacterized protein LOC105435860 [Cucumis sativus]KGN47743.1 hypothetical protein Csa_002824 [Cucumis sativus]